MVLRLPALLNHPPYPYLALLLELAQSGYAICYIRPASVS